MKSIFSSLFGLALLATAACSSSQPAKNVAQATPFVMGKADTISMQRPDLPDTRIIAWTPSDRLYRSVAIDYIEGMSQRSSLFSKPNQEMYRPMLAMALDRAGLLARSPAEARYALQISFSDLHANAIGFDFAGRSTAQYRIVSRLTGETVYAGDVNANFLVIYPELNERDLAKAYDISQPLLDGLIDLHVATASYEGILIEMINNNNELQDYFGGPYDEISQASWDKWNRSFFWAEGLAAVLGPLEVVREQLDPTNYLSFASRRNASKDPVYGARHGFLSEGGVGARDGKERGLQASEKMLGQSITKFLMGLGQSEQINYKVLLPCTMNDEVREMKIRLLSAGIGYRSEACTSDRFDDFEIGVGYTDYH